MESRFVGVHFSRFETYYIKIIFTILLKKLQMVNKNLVSPFTTGTYFYGKFINKHYRLKNSRRSYNRQHPYFRAES